MELYYAKDQVASHDISDVLLNAVARLLRHWLIVVPMIIHPIVQCHRLMVQIHRWHISWMRNIDETYLAHYRFFMRMRYINFTLYLLFFTY